MMIVIITITPIILIILTMTFFFNTLQLVSGSETVDQSYWMYRFDESRKDQILLLLPQFLKIF